MSRQFTQNLDTLIDTFQIIEVKQSANLDAWLAVQVQPLKPSAQEIFQMLLEEIQDKGDQWNEEELKMKFIALLFFIAEIESKHKIQVFYERQISATVQQHKLTVVSDCMLATPLGKNTPRHPYFFLQEFKKGKGDKFDPEAQMLTAMLIAQTINQDNLPVYGAFIIGKNWVFTVLHGQEYCRSHQYDAAVEGELMQLIFILRNLKTLILKR